MSDELWDRLEPLLPAPRAALRGHLAGPSPVDPVDPVVARRETQPPANRAPRQSRDGSLVGRGQAAGAVLLSCWKMTELRKPVRR